MFLHLPLPPTKWSFIRAESKPHYGISDVDTWWIHQNTCDVTRDHVSEICAIQRVHASMQCFKPTMHASRPVEPACFLEIYIHRRRCGHLQQDGIRQGPGRHLMDRLRKVPTGSHDYIIIYIYYIYYIYIYIYIYKLYIYIYIYIYIYRWIWPPVGWLKRHSHINKVTAKHLEREIQASV